MSSDLMFSIMSKILTGVSTCLHNNIQLLVERAKIPITVEPSRVRKG